MKDDPSESKIVRLNDFRKEAEKVVPRRSRLSIKRIARGLAVGVGGGLVLATGAVGAAAIFYVAVPSFQSSEGIKGNTREDVIAALARKKIAQTLMGRGETFGQDGLSITHAIVVYPKPSFAHFIMNHGWRNPAYDESFWVRLRKTRTTEAIVTADRREAPTLVECYRMEWQEAARVATLSGSLGWIVPNRESGWNVSGKTCLTLGR